MTCMLMIRYNAALKYCKALKMENDKKKNITSNKAFLRTTVQIDAEPMQA